MIPNPNPESTTHLSVTRVWSADLIANASELSHSTPSHFTAPSKYLENPKPGGEGMFGMTTCSPFHLPQLKPSHLGQLKGSYTEAFCISCWFKFVSVQAKIVGPFICSTNPPRSDRKLKKSCSYEPLRLQGPENMSGTMLWHRLGHCVGHRVAWCCL